MISLEQLEDQLKEEPMLGEEDARKVLEENATNGGLLREAAEKGYLEAVKFFLEAKERFELPFKIEFMCSNTAAADGNGNTPLHLAASNGHVGIVECIALSGQSINITNDGDETPLYVACREGHENVVRVLVIHGGLCDRPFLNALFNPLRVVVSIRQDLSAECQRWCAPNARENKDINVDVYTVGDPYFRGFGKRPIEIAAFKGHVTIVQCLLDGGSKVFHALAAAVEAGCENVVSLLIQHMNSRHKRFFYEAILKAAEMGNVHLLEMLLHVSPDLSIYEHFDVTPMQVAARLGHIDIANLLLSLSVGEKRGCLWDRHQGEKDSAVERALENRHIAFARLLSQHGFPLDKVRFLCKMIKRGRVLAVRALLAMGEHLPQNAVHLACNGKLEMVEFLLQKGMSVNKSLKCGTPLHEACCSGNENIVKFLISRGANVNAMNDNAKTPLHMTNKFSIQKLLIENRADPNMVDNESCSVLHRAENVELIELLRQCNALIEARDEKRKTPLMVACICGRKEIAELLIQNGHSVNTKDNDGNTPLTLAIQHNRPSIVDLLLESDVDVNKICYQKYETALHVACRMKNIKCALLLLNWNAAVNVKNVDGDSPLHVAAKSDSISLLKLLVEYDAHINAVNKYGRTALHYSKTKKTAQFLLGRGADALILDVEEDTPLDRAQMFNHVEVVAAICEHLSRQIK